MEFIGAAVLALGLTPIVFVISATWSSFLLAVPIAMIAYTGIETVSNLAEEARDPVRAIPRSIGAAIVGAAEESGADLIVTGSAPRWRRQSWFFSPTVEYTLRKAPCEVLVVAFSQGVLEEELERPLS